MSVTWMKAKYRRNRSGTSYASSHNDQGTKHAKRRPAPQPKPNHPTLVVNAATGKRSWLR